MLVFIFMLVGCGSQETQSNEGVSEQEATAKTDTNAEADQSNEETPKEEPKQEEAFTAIGEAFTLKDWEVSLDSFEFSKEVEDGMFVVTAGEGNK